MEKSGLGMRMKARLQARRQRSAERARMRQENNVEDNARRALQSKNKGNGASGGV
jgi:hypothetical protein